MCTMNTKDKQIDLFLINGFYSTANDIVQYGISSQIWHAYQI